LQAREKIEGREGATEDSHGLSPACGFREEAKRALERAEHEYEDEEATEPFASSFQTHGPASHVRAGPIETEPSNRVSKPKLVFNSLTFILFFTVVVAIYRLPIGWTARKLHLLLASYLFYAAWNPPFVILLWISTAVDWWAARRLAQNHRKLFVGISLLVNLGMLGFFKYADFALEALHILLAGLGIDYRPPELGMILPVGISFYTFQTISYTIDVYRGRIPPARSLLDFALYVSFFPQLVAGPIVRATRFLPQLASEARFSVQQLGFGAALLVAGLFEKVVLADGIFAPIADQVFASPARAGFLDAWCGTLAFACQILLDFSGYSTCAIGAALCLGFNIPANFRMPYAAIGFSDFWRRWHISLSSWLRDYLYISLGGNRRGALRTQINLMIVMLLGGLWHGASWQFVLWGGIHGLLLIGERQMLPWIRARTWHRNLAVRFAAALATFAAVCVAWVPFRATSLADTRDLLGAMLLGSGENIELGQRAVVLAMGVAGLLLIAQWVFRERDAEKVWAQMPIALRALVLSALLLAIVFAPGENRAFIYFQF
jgi:alginate O-acetyltransferase complex protein AlgI